MQTIVKAANEAGLLALMPHVLGFRPSTGVVLIAFRGNRTHGAFRFELPQPTKARPALIYKRISRAYVRMLEKLPTADGVVVVVVTNDAFGTSAVPPRMDLVVEIMRTIQHSRFALKGVLCQARDGWAPYFDPDVPPGGYPLADLVNSDITAQLPPDLPEVVDLTAVPQRVPDASLAVKSRVMSDYQRISRALDEDAPGDPACGTPHGYGTFDDLVEAALSFSDDEFEQFAGLFLASAQNLLVGTLMVVQWASDDYPSEHLWMALLYPSPETASGLREFTAILGGFARQPDPERLEDAIVFVSKLVACADDAARPVPLYMLGWLHWALGHGSVASVVLAEAIRLAPDFPVANDLMSTIRHGELPDWAFYDTAEDDDDTAEFDVYDDDNTVDDGTEDESDARPDQVD